MAEQDGISTTSTGAVVAHWWARAMPQDVLLAAVLVILCVLVNAPPGLGINPDTVGGSPDGQQISALVWWVATGFIAAAVALRRRWPLPGLAVATAATAVHLSQGTTFTLVDLGEAVLLYTVAVRYQRTRSGLVLGVLLLLTIGWIVAAAATGRPIPGLPSLPYATAPGVREPDGAGPPARVISNTWTGSLVLGSVLIASWAAGAAASSRRAYLNELQTRARNLEHQRDQQAELATAAERARISRELHDVVAHGLSVMVTQAQGAQAAFDSHPADARAALAAIITTGRGSLADMRRALARTDGVADPWHPQPGLTGLPALISQVTAAGTPVRLQVRGAPSQIPATVDLSAYRIVQEALTNTMKHGGPGAEAEVTITYSSQDLDIEIKDSGHGAAAGDGHGMGLRGMRERARLLGGKFTAQPSPAGGFAVHAVLPLPEVNA